MSKLKNGPKIAYLDIETAPGLGWAWTTYETNIIDWQSSWFILCFSVRWAHETSTRTYALPDFPGYRKHRENDKALVQKLWKVLDEADIVIAHNGDRFDIKKANARFVFHGLTPPSPYKSIDTLKIARSKFRFDSNRLDSLGGYLRLGRKKVHTGFALWKKCMDGDLPSWATMKSYCARDVKLLYDVFHRLRPWATNLPNLNLYKDGNEEGKCSCPTCQSENVQKRGVLILRALKRVRYHCQNCGAWFSGDLIKKSKRKCSDL